MTGATQKHTGIGIYGALFPVAAIVAMLAYNVNVYGDSAVAGSNQFILLLGGAIAALVGFYHKITYDEMLKHVSGNLKSTAGAILILLMVGALSGAWLISGIIPAMIYYGLKLLNPSIFLPATLLICSVVSLATGSSWSTSATVGIALVGIGKTIGVPDAMTAGAVISGAYFGDKLSPMSDTTNLAPAMAGTDLFTHVRYMTITTVPSYIVTLLAFIIMGFTLDPKGSADTAAILSAIEASFCITPWLFIVPALVIFMIVRKTQPLIALLIGALLGGVFALVFQPHVVAQTTGVEKLDFHSAYKGIMNALTVKTSVATGQPALNDLFSAKGMKGMMDTVWLVICAMVFGGVMEAIGALHKISSALLKMASSVFGLFASTVASCVAVNLTASDQYLAIVVPGKMFSEPFK
ncbi:MAG: sodium:proton antiporter, partial [Elusimicrobia bacterium RIFOXYB2_FULL_62_6]